jgi:hypothetical protein
MKPFKKILLLSLSVAAIVLLWLVPGINTAKSVRYTRTFEDTDNRPATAEATVGVSDTVRLAAKSSPDAITLAGKKFKKEHIETEAGISNVKMEMFSRATHFHEEKIPKVLEELIVEIDTVTQTIVAQDSVNHVADSTANIQ